MRKRLRIWLPVFIVLVVGYVVYKLFDAAVIKSDYYRVAASAQQTNKIEIKANRGAIYDRNQKILAQSKTTWNLVLSPGAIGESREAYQTRMANAARKKKTEAVAAGKFTDGSYDENRVYDEAESVCRILQDVFGLDYNKWLSVCHDPANAKSKYIVVKKNVTREEYEKFNEYKKENLLSLYSISCQEDTKRSYPNDNLAGTVIGFTDYENQGVYGLEAHYNEYLAGVNGKIIQERSANGQALPYGLEERHDAQEGNSLVLTLDTVLQHYLEKNLELAVAQHKAAYRATGIMMDPSTGAIYAMATSPGFNLNNPSQGTPVEQNIYESMKADVKKIFTKDRKRVPTDEELDIEMLNMPWRNKAISELYFPGSVFKVITCASALEEKKVDLSSTFYCAGSVNVAGTVIHCWSLGGHGTLNLVEAITKSCNPAFIDIGQRLGKESFSDYFEAFGFTEKTGIDLPNEAESIYKKRKDMGIVELASSSFGQTNKVTPIQMITAYAAAVNGGYLVTPHVTDKIIDKNGNVIKTVESRVKRQVISEETSAIMRNILEQVVEANGGTNAAIKGYRIGGKSGTTQKLDEWSSAEMRYVSTFGAFTPADNPKVIMLVCVDEPLGGQYYGSAVAAPVVSTVFKEGLEQLEIYPQYTADELAKQDTNVPYIIGKSVMDATTRLNQDGLSAKFIGEGAHVLRTVPDSGQLISRSGTVVVYMSDEPQTKAAVPAVIGMTAAEANTVITTAGLNIRISGGASANVKAKAVSQSIQPGVQAEKGTVIEVTFVVNDETG